MKLISMVKWFLNKVKFTYLESMMSELKENSASFFESEAF